MSALPLFGQAPAPAPAVSFFVSCVPPKTSHHAKRIVRFGKFSRLADKPELEAAKQTLESLLQPHQPSAPVPGPVVLRITWIWPFLASHPKRVRAAGLVPCTSKPDLSNVLKTLEDRLVRLRFIEDDRSVVQVEMQKYWGATPGISVEIRPWA